MVSGRQVFILKSVIGILIIIVSLTLIGWSADATIARFGNIGWVYLFIGIFLTFFGALFGWGTFKYFLDARHLQAYRASPDERFEDGQRVALSGQVQMDGPPLIAPFSGRDCAAFAYQVSGLRSSSTSNGSVRQLCLLGFHMGTAVLDCGNRQFHLGAMAEVDADLRSIATGGEWGDLGLAKIRSSVEQREPVSEADARGALEEAQLYALPPIAEDFFVADTNTGASSLSVTEDIVPVDSAVTIIGAYSTQTRGLNGECPGKMRVFEGDLEHAVAEANKNWHQGLKVSASMVTVGVLLLTPAWWFPG